MVCMKDRMFSLTHGHYKGLQALQGTRLDYRQESIIDRLE